MTKTGTYVYCLVGARTAPRAGRSARGLSGTGPIRAIDVGDGLFAIAADAPLSEYGERAINARLSDLDWVARCALAHEAVVEQFIDRPAVLPMKLFTIFNDDERVRAHVRGDRVRLRGIVRRIASHREWGVRVRLDRERALQAVAPDGRKRAKASASGLAYLTRKKAQRDAAAELRMRARETAADLYDRFAAKARMARRRPASDLPAEGGTLLLDAAFLVPRSREASFRALAAREARARADDGYTVTLNGPWPPYTFVQD